MPGRNAHEAVTDFINPLARAVSVLDGYSKLTLSKRGGYRVNEELAWILNEGDGLPLRGVGVYFAEMGFKVVPVDPKKHEGKYRVTTLRYRYKLESDDGSDIWLVHWHPDGASRFLEPHIHVQPDLSCHFSTPRITLEQTIQWCIELGAPLACAPEEAVSRLAESSWPHILFRSWSGHPREHEEAE